MNKMCDFIGPLLFCFSESDVIDLPQFTTERRQIFPESLAEQKISIIMSLPASPSRRGGDALFF
jgi:hypothetical protein